MMLFLLTHATDVWVYDWECDCGTINKYDGVEDHLYRPHKAKPSRLIHESLFDQYRALVYTSSTPEFAWHKSIDCVYHNHNSAEPFISRPAFNKYFKAHEKLIGTNKQIKCTECHKENRLPKIITSDGTELLQTYANVQNCISPAETVYCHKNADIKMKKCWTKTRKVYITKRALRQRVVQHFKLSKMHKQPTDQTKKDENPLTDPELETLYQDLKANLGNDNYVNCLKWCKDNQYTSLMLQSKYVSGFWEAVTGFIRGVAHENCPLFTLVKNPMIESILNWQWDEERNQPNIDQFQQFYQKLVETMPLFAKSAQLLFITPSIQFPKCLYLLIREIAQLSNKCITALETARNQQPKPPQCNKIDDIYTKSHISGTCYGSYKDKPITTMRPRYDYDSEVNHRKKWKQMEEDTVKLLSSLSINGDEHKEEEEKQEQKVNDQMMELDHDSDDVQEEDEKIDRISMESMTEEDGDDVTEEQMTTACTKIFNKYDKMSGGLIVASCVEHSQAIGYNIIKGAESVNDHFSLVQAIYPGNEAPDHHIMDNACNYYPYCMARETTKFKDMCAWTDEFHGIAGHKCGLLQNVKISKQISDALCGANDSIIEQMNRILQRLHICAMWMRLDTFDTHVKLILDMFNRRSIRKKEGKKIFY